MDANICEFGNRNFSKFSKKFEMLIFVTAHKTAGFH